jgi:hypothetical protein
MAVDRVYDPGVMKTPTRGPVQEIVGSLVGRLRYPWVFVLLAVVFVADTLIPDPIPFVDEIMLALLTFLVGTWRTRGKTDPEVVDVSSYPEPKDPPPPDE